MGVAGTLSCLIHGVTFADRPFDLQIVIQTEPPPGDLAVSVTAQASAMDEGPRRFDWPSQLGLTREQAVLLGRFLLTAQHCGDPE